MSGWDSRLEKGPDGQKCRTCIYRAANRYGPWGCGYADVTGQSKLAAFPDAEPGTRAGRHCIVYQRGRAAKKQAPILPQKTKKPPAEPKPKRQDTLAEQSADRRRAAGALRPRVDRRADRGTAGHEPRDDQKMAAAQRVSGKRMADEESRKGHVILQRWSGGKAGPSLEHHRKRRDTLYNTRARVFWSGP